jgi:hypothetical protein
MKHYQITLSLKGASFLTYDCFHPFNVTYNYFQPKLVPNSSYHSTMLLTNTLTNVTRGAIALGAIAYGRHVAHS